MTTATPTRIVTARRWKPGERALDWPWLGGTYDDAEIAAVTEILRDVSRTRRSLDANAPEVRAFEGKFARSVGARHAIAVNAAGTGLDLCAEILGLGPSDEVIVTPLTFSSTALAVLGTGARPVPADIDARTLNLDAAAVEAALTPATRAIFTVHYGGSPGGIGELLELARARGIPIVEDAAHAAGAAYQGRKVGALGTLTVFSFQSQKNITTLGEGGMVTTDDDTLAERARQARSFGGTAREGWSYPVYPYHPMSRDILTWGTNRRMTPLQAAVGMTQLDKLEALNESRRRVAAMLTERLRDAPEFEIPAVPEGCVHAFYLYTLLLAPHVTVNKYAYLQRLATEYRVTCILHYLPWYHFTLFQQSGCPTDRSPIAEEVFTRSLNPPLHPSFTEEDVDYLAWALRDALRRCGEEG